MATAVLDRQSALSEADRLESEAFDAAAAAPSAFFRPNPAQWRYLRTVEQVYAQPVAYSKVNTVLLMGGNGIGKTRLISECCANFVLGPQSEWFETPFWQNWRRPTRVRLCSTRSALDEGLLRELMAMLGPHCSPGYPTKNGQQWLSLWKFPNGSRIDVYTWNQAITEHAGGSCDVLIRDEPGPEDIAGEDQARLRYGGPILWAMTPVDRDGLSSNVGWVFDKITSAEEGAKNNYHTVYADLDDNCQDRAEKVVTPRGTKVTIRGLVSRAVVQDKFDTWSQDPATLQARFYGRHVRELGRVLKHWDDAKHVFKSISVHPSWPRYCSIDTHPAKPQVIIYGVLTPFSELLILREIVDTGLISEIAQKLRDLFLAYGFPKFTLIDPLACTPNPLTGHTIMQEYQKQIPGANIVSAGAEKAEKDVGIAHIKERLVGIDGRPLLRVHESCTFTISQAKRWMVDPRTMKPEKKHDDAWECIYRMVLQLPQYQTQQQSDLEQRLASMTRSSLVI